MTLIIDQLGQAENGSVSNYSVIISITFGIVHEKLA